MANVPVSTSFHKLSFIGPYVCDSNGAGNRIESILNISHHYGKAYFSLHWIMLWRVAQANNLERGFNFNYLESSKDLVRVNTQAIS
ncbi:protein of unknown function [Paraburkholderia dioscoreae]|uniref:Uncharacterized protein n=1 Tax=Paraburkholderia dioscoreae TaxID=2604047 RepID=A0A5Q4YXZ9_9BURK|nr:protein of unknown function [Paraburkholderia dioscoreae]